MTRRLGLGIMALAGLLAALGAAAANPIVEWNALMVDAIRSDNSGPTLSSRNLAILSLAMYDGVNSVTRTHQPYRFQLEAAPDTSLEAVISEAGRETMLQLYPALAGQTESLWARQLAALPDGRAVTEGLALGRSVAQQLITLRSADGATTELPYIPSEEPGQWRRTPPFFRPPLTPHWRYVQPFCLPAVEPFLPPPPPPLTSREYAEALNEVKALGEKNSPIRTPEQSLIALFWSDFSYTSMPPGHWHEIVGSMALERNLSLPDTARLFALLSMAQADGAIVCWEAKFRWNLWRPVTAIHRADEDGNPWTEADRDWEQYLPSPPFPAYTSGHSTFSKAGAQVLTRFFGTDAVTFSARSDSVPDLARTYHSLAACADEIGRSRIYGGFHYRFDDIAGKRSGARVADYVSANSLLANADLPLVRFEGFMGEAPLLRVHGRIGELCFLEFSSDLKSWRAVSSVVAVAGGMLVPDSAANGQSAGFYRVR